MTSRPFVVTPQAREDLLQIWNYIAEDSVDSADEVLGKLLGLGFCPAGTMERPGLAAWTSRKNVPDDLSPLFQAGRELLLAEKDPSREGKRRQERSSP